jgi:hypothetical protein
MSIVFAVIWVRRRRRYPDDWKRVIPEIWWVISWGFANIRFDSRFQSAILAVMQAFVKHFPTDINVIVKRRHAKHHCYRPRCMLSHRWLYSIWRPGPTGNRIRDLRGDRKGVVTTYFVTHKSMCCSGSSICVEVIWKAISTNVYAVSQATLQILKARTVERNLYGSSCRNVRQWMGTYRVWLQFLNVRSRYCHNRGMRRFRLCVIGLHMASWVTVWLASLTLEHTPLS